MVSWRQRWWWWWFLRYPHIHTHTRQSFKYYIWVYRAKLIFTWMKKEQDLLFYIFIHRITPCTTYSVYRIVNTLWLCCAVYWRIKEKKNGAMLDMNIYKKYIFIVIFSHRFYAALTCSFFASSYHTRTPSKSIVNFFFLK